MSETAKKKGFFSRLFKGEGEPDVAEKDLASSSDTSVQAGRADDPGDQLAAIPEQQQDRFDDGLARAHDDAHVAAPIPDRAAAAEVAEEIQRETATAAEQNEDRATSAPDHEGKKSSWFGRLKAGLTKTSSKLSDGIGGLFTKRKLGADTLDDLEDLLIQADLGVETSMRITTALSEGRYQKGISADDVRQVLATEVERVLEPVARPLEITSGCKPHVILMVGVNGTGKTTTIGKLAQRFAGEGKKVMMAAGDTFRAAAIDQLRIWGERSGATVMARDVGADASGLAFDALKSAQAAAYDVLLVDTAGRLQNKQELMDELEKVVRVLKKVDPTAPHDVLLVLDATTGQNALQQVEVFRQRAGVTGLILTKLDGTARGGIIVAIAEKYGLPVHAIGVGEGIEDLQPFAADAFARAIADVA